MSRIGKQKIHLTEGVDVSSGPGGEALVKGKGRTLKIPLPANLKLHREGNTLSVIRESDDRTTRAFHGLTKALIQNAVIGLSKGWSKTLEMNGVGYRARLSGKKLELSLGYSHPIVYDIPEGVEITVEKQTKLIINGVDKELVGLPLIRYEALGRLSLTWPRA